MASNSLNPTRFTLLLLTIAISISLHLSAVASFEFQVGGNKGWVVPPANDSKIYNDWASENRFRAGDTIRFRYKKDSVMEVSDEEYKKCNSSQPEFFSNTGDTVFNLRHSGTFYFISGASGHCEKGQRMIVKVMADGDSSSPSEKSAAGSGNMKAGVSWVGVLKLVSAPLAVSYVASIMV